MALEEANGSEGYTQDGTVDLKGNPILRSKRGRWTACSFVVGTYTLLSLSLSLIFATIAMSLKQLQ